MGTHTDLVCLWSRPLPRQTGARRWLELLADRGLGLDEELDWNAWTEPEVLGAGDHGDADGDGALRLVRWGALAALCAQHRLESLTVALTGPHGSWSTGLHWEGEELVAVGLSNSWPRHFGRSPEAQAWLADLAQHTHALLGATRTMVGLGLHDDEAHWIEAEVSRLRRLEVRGEPEFLDLHGPPLPPARHRGALARW